MIERPSAASALARARTSKAVSVPSRAMRPAICNIQLLRQTSAWANAHGLDIRALNLIAIACKAKPSRAGRDPVARDCYGRGAPHQGLLNSCHSRRSGQDRNRLGGSLLPCFGPPAGSDSPIGAGFLTETCLRAI